MQLHRQTNDSIRPTSYALNACSAQDIWSAVILVWFDSRSDWTVKLNDLKVCAF